MLIFSEENLVGLHVFKERKQDWHRLTCRAVQIAGKGWLLKPKGEGRGLLESAPVNTIGPLRSRRNKLRKS